MKRLRVLIATTEGPSEVQQIIEEDPEIRSVVCLDGTSEALPISAEYEAFVRKPTGIVERLCGHAAYRVDVSHPISGGRSWQLGLLVAHDLFAAGQLATKGTEADEVLWVTGEVRHNLDIVRVDHWREKLQQSANALRAAADGGTQVTLLVPEANRSEIAAEIDNLGLRDKVRLEGVQHWYGTGAHGSRRATMLRPRRRVLVIAAIGAIVLAATAYEAWTWRSARTAAGLAQLPQAPAPKNTAAPPAPPPRPEPMPPPARPAPPDPAPVTRPPAPPALNIEVFAVEYRPPAGRTCGGQRLTGGGLTETVVDRDASGNFPRRTAAGLCDVEFRVKNTGATARHLWLHVQPTLDGTRPRTGDATIDPGKELSVRVGASPWQSGSPWDATVIVALNPPTLETADRGVQELTDALRAAHATYEVVGYTAAAPAGQPYR